MLKQLYLIIILTFCAVFAQAEEVKGQDGCTDLAL